LKAQIVELFSNEFENIQSIESQIVRREKVVREIREKVVREIREKVVREINQFLFNILDTHSRIL
jgi:hypothetical protein